MMPDISESSASFGETRRLTPLIDAMRLPSSTPARSAGPPAVTDDTRIPSVSRMLLEAEVVTPMTARGSSSFEKAKPRASGACRMRTRGLGWADAVETTLAMIANGRRRDALINPRERGVG
jgi:hypothetical protein